jgi:hypothetical protein
MTTLARKSLTPLQRRAIFYEFGRLGFRAADRDERLKVASELLDLNSELRSINHLSLGQAGKLISILRRTRTAAELSPVINADQGDADQGDDDQDNDPAGLSFGEIVLFMAAAAYLAWKENH